MKVKDGYARNFLLPSGKALRATKANKERFEKERVQLEARNLELKKEADAVAAKLNGKVFAIIRQAGETGQLYGSVSARDLADQITAAGISVGRSQIQLNTPIKNIGLHQVLVSLHPEVDATITVNVARSAGEADRQSQGEDLTQRHDEPSFETFNPEEFGGEDDEG